MVLEKSKNTSRVTSFNTSATSNDPFHACLIPGSEFVIDSMFCFQHSAPNGYLLICETRSSSNLPTALQFQCIRKAQPFTKLGAFPSGDGCPTANKMRMTHSLSWYPHGLYSFDCIGNSPANRSPWCSIVLGETLQILHPSVIKPESRRLAISELCIYHGQDCRLD